MGIDMPFLKLYIKTLIKDFLEEEGLKCQDMLQWRFALLLVYLSVDTIKQHSIKQFIYLILCSIQYRQALKSSEIIFEDESITSLMDCEKCIVGREKRMTTWAKSTVLCLRSACCPGELPIAPASVTTSRTAPLPSDVSVYRHLHLRQSELLSQSLEKNGFFKRQFW